MSDFNISDFTFSDAMSQFSELVDAILIVDGNADIYRAVLRRRLFKDCISETGSYHDLIEKLWYHFHDSTDSVVDDYHVFIPSSGKFSGKYSKKVNLLVDGITHTVQITIYPLEKENMYMFILDEMDSSQYMDETLTNNKVDTIQNTYLFSMYVDIVRDTINSISVTELSDEVINQQLKYSEWRMMIVNMIGADDQALFLERTEPEYLKKNLTPGRTTSFDCLMMNLEGKYIWVKLIFSRAETRNDNDFRFVFMVQNIHENAVELMSTLKMYEELASMDSLTAVFNHGRIETEVYNAIDAVKKNGTNTSLMLLDIDFFKHVNDEFGHAVGDSTLVHFVDTVKNTVSECNAVIGRWGGEEFVAVFYDKSKEEIAELAETIRERVAAESFNKVGGITCSIGVTEISPEDSFDSAFERVDKAVYDAKAGGRNCVRIIMPAAVC